VTLSIYKMQLRNIGRAKRIVTDQNHSWKGNCHTSPLISRVLDLSRIADFTNFNRVSHAMMPVVSNSERYTKSNAHLNLNLTTEEHAIVNIQLNIVTCPTYSHTFKWNSVSIRAGLTNVGARFGKQNLRGLLTVTRSKWKANWPN